MLGKYDSRHGAINVYGDGRLPLYFGLARRQLHETTTTQVDCAMAADCFKLG
jgi:hypothetical protein